MVVTKNILRLIKQLYKCELDADLLASNKCLTKDDALRTAESSILNQMLNFSSIILKTDVTVTAILATPSKSFLSKM
jgi:hypothetical protein